MKNHLINTDFTAVAASLPLSSFTTAVDAEVVNRWFVTEDPKSGTAPSISISKNAFVYPLSGGVPSDEALNYLAFAVADLGTTLGTGYYWRFEGRTRLRTLRSKRLTFSFWAKASVANTQIAVILRRNYGVDGSADSILKSQAFNLSTTWQRYGFNLAVPDIAAGTVTAPGAFLGFGIYLFGDTTSLSPLAIGLPGVIGTVSIGLPQAEEGNLSSYEANSDVRAVGTGAVKALGTLTFADQPTANDTFTIGSQTYTFKASVTTTANQVKIGASLAATITNAADAVNGLSSASGVTYGSATVANVSASATYTGTTLVAAALIAGTAGNSVASTESGSNTSWGASTLAGGVAPTLDY